MLIYIYNTNLSKYIRAKSKRLTSWIFQKWEEYQYSRFGIESTIPPDFEETEELTDGEIEQIKNIRKKSKK